VLPLRLADLPEVGLLAIVLVAVIAKIPRKERR
jgi:hypothetical protein